MAGYIIRNDIGATVFSILSGLSAIFFVAWVFSPGGCARQEDPAIAPLPADSGEEFLQQQLAEARSELEEESTRRADLALSLRENEESLAALQTEHESLLSSHSETTAQLEEWNALLSASESGKNEVATVVAKLKALEEKNQTLIAQLAETPQADLEALESENSQLEKQLESERKACEVEKAKLSSEIDSLRKELDQAVYGEQLKPAGGFPALDLPFLVNDPIQLNRKVRPVFIQLRGAQEEASELEKLYAKLTEDGSVSSPHQVPFSVGSAEVIEEESGKLDAFLTDLPAGARFLVVGYASTDGDAKSNYELSSQRASSVAAALAANKDVSDDAVQAVYFGQTKRFSTTEMAPNRIVEIWRVQ